MQKVVEEETKWDWIPASQMIQTQFNGETQFLDLAPHIIITHPDGDQFPDPIVKLYIDTEKSLQQTEDHGWNWHKSWNLPNITVRLEIKDSQTNELLISPKNVFAQLFAVKAVLENPQSFYLVDVGLRGTSKQEFQDGQAFFSALRFASTSYNNEGVKFHLLLCIYIQNTESEIPKVLNTTISPPIFVDSRKTAKHSNDRMACQFADPFPLDSLDKEFIKRENKRKSDHDIKIDNDVEGLLNYLTAPNIRHKVKHPFFLAMKFSNCFKIFYNKGLLQNVQVDSSPQMQTFQLIERMQTVLLRDNPARSALQNEERSFIIMCDECEDISKTKKLWESIDYLNVPSLQVFKSSDHIPPFFEKIDATELIETYKAEYEQIVILTKQLKLKYQRENPEYSESDASSERSESEPKVHKKVKHSAPLAAPEKPKAPGTDPTESAKFEVLPSRSGQAQPAVKHNIKVPQPQHLVQPVQLQRMNGESMNIPMSQIQQQPQLLQQLPYFQQMQQAQMQNPALNQLYWQQQIMLQQEMQLMNPMMMYQQFMNPAFLMQSQRLLAQNPLLQQQLLLQQHMIRQQQLVPSQQLNQGSNKPNIKDENQ